MFFRKKKDELSDQITTYQERKAPRWGSQQEGLNAGISIKDFDGEGQVGNVSISGCGMKSVTYVNITPDTVYKVTITPGPEDKVEPFSLSLRLSWTKSTETVFLAGFSLESGEDASKLKRYVDSLCSRGIKPDYGNMGPGQK